MFLICSTSLSQWAFPALIEGLSPPPSLCISMKIKRYWSYNWGKDFDTNYWFKIIDAQNCAYRLKISSKMCWFVNFEESSIKDRHANFEQLIVVIEENDNIYMCRKCTLIYLWKYLKEPNLWYNSFPFGIKVRFELNNLQDSVLLTGTGTAEVTATRAAR